MGKVGSFDLDFKFAEKELYVSALLEGVIPKPRVLSSGARDLPAQRTHVHPSQTRQRQVL
jgi:hypothetical protein